MIPMEEKNFNLSKVKMLPKGGIQASYQLTETVGGEVSVTDYQATYTRDVHPDMTELFRDLRNIVARVFGMTSFLSFLATDEIKLPEGKMILARSFADELKERIDVRGISLSGSEEDRAVVITAVYETENGLKTAINTPKIKTAQISYGFEEELDEIVDQIKSEVFRYLFEGKQAQLSLFGQKPDVEDDLPEGEL